MTDTLSTLKHIYETILNKVDAGIHAVDETGKTIIYNEKMTKMELMDEQDVLHKNLLDVFMFKENQQSTLVQALQKGKETVNVKQTYFNNQGQEITTINNTFPILKDGVIQGAVEIAQDLSLIHI